MLTAGRAAGGRLLRRGGALRAARAPALRPTAANAAGGGGRLRRGLGPARAMAAEPPSAPAVGATAAIPGVSSCFDSGNGILESVEAGPAAGVPVHLRGVQRSPTYEVKVKIADDPYTEVDGRSHKMWFHFKVSNLRAAGGPVKVVLTNAGECSYPGGWGGVAPPEGAAKYLACFSVDRRSWPRLAATEYVGGELHMTLDPAQEPALAGMDAVWLAYFAPYSQEQHMELLASVVAPSPLASIATIGQTLDGADMELVTVRGPPAAGAPAEKKSLWFIARQHPGESMASWWMEGFLRRLLDPADPVARALLERADVRVVPMMNPDGARRGFLRTNAAGANLNREWAPGGAKADYSPEVLHVLREMHATGLDFCLDVHGDEALPYNFIAGGEGCPCWSPRLAELQKQWCDGYERANPDFQQVHGVSRRAAAGPGPRRVGTDRHAVRDRRAGDGQHARGVQRRVRGLRRAGDDPGDALQGQRQRAGPRARLVDGKVRAARGGRPRPVPGGGGAAEARRVKLAPRGQQGAWGGWRRVQSYTLHYFTVSVGMAFFSSAWTVSEGWAPSSSHFLTSGAFTYVSFVKGLYHPRFAKYFPSRGFRLSAATMR